MSLVSQISTAFTSVATDVKRLRTYITGTSTGDLTGLTTTSKTSIISAINEVNAASGVVQATTTTQGKIEIATDAEAVAGTDTARAVTPANVAAVFTDRIDTNTALGSSNVKVPSQLAVKTYADALIGANDAMVFKGVLDASANPNYPAANRGDTYKISVAGKVGGASGTNVEVGDTIMCITDSTSAGTQAAVGAQWNILQVNIDGAVVGPASAVSGQLASFSGTTGKLVADSGFSPSNAAIGAGSATVLPTSAQVVAYAQPLDTDLSAIGALTSAADKLPYATGAGTWALTTFTAAGRALVDDADITAQRATLSVYSQTELGDPTTDFATAYSAATV